MVLEEKLVIKPRIYQLPCIETVKKHLEINDVVLFVMAMGLGKTVTSAFIVEEWLRSGKKGLFLCHETYILEHVEQEYRKVIGDDIVYKTFYGGKDEDGNDRRDWKADQADMLFASFQSMNNWQNQWFLAFDRDHFDFMVVDESHHAQAPSYKEVIDYFQCKKIAMTATPDRMDLKDIREIFGEEVFNLPLEVGIANGWLANVEYHILSDGINNRKLKKICKEVLEEGKRVSVKQINETIFIHERDKAEKEIIAEYSKIKEFAGDRKTLLFCERTTHADRLIPHFENSGVMHSKKTYDENKKVFNAFESGELQYVASVNKFNEGKHVPGVEVIVFLRATDSLTIFWQQLGRALAKNGTKTKVIVLDFVANLERLVMIRDMMLRIQDVRDEPSGDPAGLPVDTKTFTVTGEGFEFIFSDEIVDVMKIIEALRKGFYSTWQEASVVAVEAKISSQDDYELRYKKLSPRLPSPSYIGVLYPDFPGWNMFLNKTIAPKDWITLNSLCNSGKVLKSWAALSEALSEYRIAYPEDVKEFCTDRGRLREYFSPKIASLLCEEFPPKDYPAVAKKKTEKRKRKEDGAPNNYPPGWMSAGVLLRVEGFIGTKSSIEEFAEKYRLEHSDWFGDYYRGNSKIPHYAPELCALIIAEFTNRKNAEKGWMTANGLLDKYSLIGSVISIKAFAEEHREAHPEWFKMFMTKTQYHEHYAPELCALIIEEFDPSKNKIQVGVLMSPGSIIAEYKLEMAIGTLTDFSEKYRLAHSDWFALKRSNTQTGKSELYTEELIKEILDEFGENGRYPPTIKGWSSDFDVARMLCEEKGNPQRKVIKIRAFTAGFKQKRPNWIKPSRKNGIGACEQYHPRLVQKIKEHFAEIEEKKLQPKQIPVREDKFYRTWQEASEVAKGKGFISGNDYQKRYKDFDSKLPQDASRYYSDFPGWDIFLDLPSLADWKTFSSFAEIVCTPEDGHASLKTFLGQYKNDHSEHFQMLFNKEAKRIVPHYSPVLVTFVDRLAKKKAKLISLGWQSRYDLCREGLADDKTIVALACHAHEVGNDAVLDRFLADEARVSVPALPSVRLVYEPLAYLARRLAVDGEATGRLSDPAGEVRQLGGHVEDKAREAVHGFGHLPRLRVAYFLYALPFAQFLHFLHIFLGYFHIIYS